MPLLLVKLFLGGMLKRLWGLVTALFSIIRKYPLQTAIVCLLALLWLQHGKLNGVRKDLLAMSVARDAERASHKATKDGYRKAQSAAAELDRQNINRVNREQAAALRTVENRYAINLVNERTAFSERLRTATTRKCFAGGGEGSELSSLPVLSRGPVSASGEAIIHVADAELGAGNTLRLEALIQAWKDVAAVDVNQ